MKDRKRGSRGSGIADHRGLAATGLALMLAISQPALAANTSEHKQPKPAEGLCHVTDMQDRDIGSRCTAGQKIVFLPAKFGDEQIPVLFAALFCDMSYSIAITKGAVACVYAPTSLIKK